MKKTRLNFWVDEESADEFKRLCKKTGHTMSEMFRCFIKSYLEVYELEKYVPRTLLWGNSGALFISKRVKERTSKGGLNG